MPYLLPDVWTWDMWFVDDGHDYHVFYLKASRALGDPDRRHFHVSVGHAVSDDLRGWREVQDALIASDGPAFDDFTTWTGSVVRAPDGTWRLFYTGTSRAEGGLVQRVGTATSNDLYTWEKASTDALCEADPTWYEKYDGVDWFDEAWRDPWIFAEPDNAGWHMLVTARANNGSPDGRGVVGHATSQDLETWTVRPPLSEPGAGFGQLEVPQVATIDGRHVLIFSCLHAELSDDRRAAGERGGVWAVPIDTLIGPYDVEKASRLTDESLYAGRLVQDRDGAWWLFAFCNTDSTGAFVGTLSDPLPVGWSPDGRLHVTDGRFDHLA
ncbi:glycosyl hydrolase family 32 [Parafrankia sp. EUN1f]|uniref:glycosyl hydrolase family 32 n=1 Tax=Parafrankia sp. EUN1f TaxID=102897 RepID=UPI0001C46301|nr:glycosyl hydrolase family 32 [Parafrankia sp. EUN1f]EFC82199.1 Glycosyl hydrolase family 32 domain protein [Parafrankia sp. EUN1f]